MRLIKSPLQMQKFAQACKREQTAVALVPTMGCLHAGHLSLIRKARQRVGKSGVVVVSIYVNPTQFGSSKDLETYPRPFAQDKKQCEELGVDIVFTPSNDAMYLPSSKTTHSVYVFEEHLSLQFEGKSRPSHFRGVTTIVAKLFNLVLPDIAVFGAKDYQQAAIIKKMIRDLNFPVKLVVAPTVREKDGLALSSRNRLLTPEQRQDAIILSKLLKAAKLCISQRSKPWSAAELRKRLRSMIPPFRTAEMDYIEFFAPDSLAPVTRVNKGTHMAVAFNVGSTRLIDNIRL
jgi:pantoate--beta-alanine ligase